MKRAFTLIIEDVKQYYKAIILIIVYLGLMEGCFHCICLLRAFTGLPCPGCGLTRATILLVTGHVTEAIHMHPMIIAIIGWILLFFYFRYRKERKFPNWMLGLAIGIGVMMIAVYIYRMITYFPNCEPMNYNKENFLQKIAMINFEIFR